MGMTGMDDSVDTWTPAPKDVEAATQSPDRRAAAAAALLRRGSPTPGFGGGASAGALAPGAGGVYTIAELRTPIALKEHIKRGLGNRDVGIQLTAVESASGKPISEEDAAALVAHYEQKRLILGPNPLAGARATLSPADRALRAWTNTGPHSGASGGGGGGGSNSGSADSSAAASPTLGAPAAAAAAALAAAEAALLPRRFSDNGARVSGSGADSGRNSPNLRRPGLYDSPAARRQPPAAVAAAPAAALQPTSIKRAFAGPEAASASGGDSASNSPSSTAAAAGTSPPLLASNAGRTSSGFGDGEGSRPTTADGSRAVGWTTSFGRRQPPPPLRLGEVSSGGGASSASPSLPALASPHTERVASVSVLTHPPRTAAAAVAAAAAAESDRLRFPSPGRAAPSPQDAHPPTSVASSSASPVAPVAPTPLGPAPPPYDAAAALGQQGSGALRRPHPRLSAPGDGSGFASRTTSCEVDVAYDVGDAAGAAGAPSSAMPLLPRATLVLGGATAAAGLPQRLSCNGAGLGTVSPTPPQQRPISSARAASPLSARRRSLPGGALAALVNGAARVLTPRGGGGGGGAAAATHAYAKTLASPLVNEAQIPNQAAPPAIAAAAPVGFRPLTGRISASGGGAALAAAPGGVAGAAAVVSVSAATAAGGGAVVLGSASAPVDNTALYGSPPVAATPPGNVGRPSSGVGAGASAVGAGGGSGVEAATAAPVRPVPISAVSATGAAESPPAPKAPALAAAAAAVRPPSARLIPVVLLAGAGDSPPPPAPKPPPPLPLPPRGATPTATPVLDAQLAGLREVEAEVRHELDKEAETTRQVAAIRSRMRADAVGGGKARHHAFPGDPWKKF